MSVSYYDCCYHIRFELYQHPFESHRRSYLQPLERPLGHPSGPRKGQRSVKHRAGTRVGQLPDLRSVNGKIDLKTHEIAWDQSGEEGGGSTVVNSESRHVEELKARALRDWRFNQVKMTTIDLHAAKSAASPDMASKIQRDIPASDTGSTDVSRRSATSRTHGTLANFKTLEAGISDTELGWGIVHLYRDGEEALRLNDLRGSSPSGNDTQAIEVMREASQEGLERNNTTILCIPAVPSYMTASDFLGWIGEKTRDLVSHIRMVMTGRMNRYLVLMRFRDSEVAKRWRQEWDGKVFNGMEPENCHVMFIKSVVFDTSPAISATSTISFPSLSQDPFLMTTGILPESGVAPKLALKPMPPPTPSLVELPTCPVCLERMDDTTGLLTILCQHVFHCACLQKWRGSGCPVCRHTQTTSSLDVPFGSGVIGRPNDLCAVCDCTEDLWICLICGNVGCGRYKGGHAKEHWKESAHCFALEIETQHVWDYAADLWVHRLIQTKGDGKLVELPGNSRPGSTWENHPRQEYSVDDVEMVPKSKLDGIGIEYAQMLTSQLENQRVYFEEVLKKAADKAHVASKSAETAAAQAELAAKELRALQLEHQQLKDEIVPSLEKDRDRAMMKGDKSAEIARTMTRSFQEEKQVAKGLMERIEHVSESMIRMSRELSDLKEENEDLKEQNRDLGFFISSQEKLKEATCDLGDEVTQGTISLPDRKIHGTSRKKGKMKS